MTDEQRDRAILRTVRLPRGSRVRIRRSREIKPWFRGRVGVVQGQSVLFGGNNWCVEFPGERTPVVFGGEDLIPEKERKS